MIISPVLKLVLSEIDIPSFLLISIYVVFLFISSILIYWFFIFKVGFLETTYSWILILIFHFEILFVLTGVFGLFTFKTIMEIDGLIDIIVC